MNLPDKNNVLVVRFNIEDRANLPELMRLLSNLEEKLSGIRLKYMAVEKVEAK